VAAPGPRGRSGRNVATPRGLAVESDRLRTGGEGRQPVALVVAFDRRIGARTAKLLEGMGFDVLWCPGPSGPDYTCIAVRRAHCPLAETADVIVLDLWLESDARTEGARSLDLLQYYRSTGAPVIALDHGAEWPRFFPEHQVTVLAWPPDPVQLRDTALSSLPPEAPGVPQAGGPLALPTLWRPSEALRLPGRARR